MIRYILFIKGLQNVLVGSSVLYLMAAPVVLALFPALVPASYINTAFAVSLSTATFVMAIRPLADMFPKARWLRSLVILRKGFGVVSASVIVGFILTRIMQNGLGAYLLSWLEPSYWSLEGFALFAHLGDVTAIVLLVTSNNFSKRKLGKSWKRVQKLAYVYFYAAALYKVLAFDSVFAGVALVSVTVLVLMAFVRNKITRLTPVSTLA